jgi:hypothetical protein
VSAASSPVVTAGGAQHQQPLTRSTRGRRRAIERPLRMLPPVDRWRAMRFDAIPAPARPVLRCTPSSKAACCLPPARRHLRLGRERLLLLWGAARDHLDRVCLRERLQREAPTTRAPRMQSRPTAQADGAGRRNRPTAQADGTGRRNRPTEQADGAGRAGPACR